MVDAAGVVTTSNRSFVVLPPRPQVSGRSPASGATGVPRDVRPAVVFDAPVTGVSATSFKLRDVASGAAVPATVSYDPSTRRATLRPASLLGSGKTYRLFLTAAINGPAGRTLTPIDWTFKVSTDATKPTLVGRSPASGATAVARTTTVAVRFSEAVRNVTSATFQLRDTVTNAYVSAVVAYDATTKRATLDPSGTLVANRTYLAIVRSGISDRAGNPVSTTTWSFKTGS
jgi:hypothetical protein